MHAVKRIEIVANSVELAKIVESLNKSKVQGYTVIDNVGGQIFSGETSDDITSNVYVIAYCLPDDIKPVTENIRPILNKFGGTCHISDVMEIRSMRCVASM